MLVMALTFAIIIPVIAILYVDMHNATGAAVREVHKMKELRLQILKEMREQ